MLPAGVIPPNPQELLGRQEFSRLLQSYIGLAGGSLDPSQRADVLVELYELLGRAGEPGHAERLIAFHATLGNLLRGSRRTLIA